MSSKISIHRWQTAAAAGGLAFALGLTSCGKPPVAKRDFSDHSVATEEGELPAAGKASRLLNEQSAFLRKHAKDPVEWYPWGAEPFERAKRENKPLLVSIGYASCPWSQKMHTDSFLDAGIARFMNRHFVCVLVDREERPDVNTAFLQFAYAKQKISGWPLHVFLTPGGRPIYQGIYFPAVSSGSSPSWGLTIEHVANNWESSPEYVTVKANTSADAYLDEFRRRWLGPPPEGIPESPEVKAFLALPPEARPGQLSQLSGDKLQYTLGNLPAPKLLELWAQLLPEVSAATVDRLTAQGAAFVFPKLKSPAREPVFARFVQQANDGHYQKLRGSYDPGYGGFAPPPRFAPHQTLDFLIRLAFRERGDRFSKQEEALEMVSNTIDHMLAGGVFDQIGGGFHRYSTDIYWSVPQFEKMLYDQGYMAQTLVNAGQAMGRPDYLKAAAGLLAYVGRELSHPEGGFYCAEGSSSPGHDGAMTEGAFYVWEKSEIDREAGDAAPLLNLVFGIEDRGNLPLDSMMRQRLGNKNVLMRKMPLEEAAKTLGMEPAAAQAKLEEGMARLLEARNKRPRPPLEDKVLTSWSGVVISSFARTGWALNDPALIKRGERAVEFILTKLRSKDGGILHAFLDGPSTLPGYSEDYATLIAALIDLYEATGNARWLTTAIELQERQIKDLWDEADGGFFDGPESPLLFHRMKSMDESSEISPGATSLLNLVNLSSMVNNTGYREKAHRLAERYGVQASALPAAFIRFFKAVEMLTMPPQQVVISVAADDPAGKELVDLLRTASLSGVRVLHMDGGESQKLLTEKVPELAPLAAVSGQPAIHFCQGFKPEKSIKTATELSQWINAHYRFSSGAP